MKEKTLEQALINLGDALKHFTLELKLVTKPKIIIILDWLSYKLNGDKRNG